MTFLKLIRYKNLLMVLLTMVLTKYALINSIATSANLPLATFLIFAFSILLITASGNLINDIYDVETDLVNKPNKVIVSKRISFSSAWKIYWILSILGILLGAYSLFLLNSLYLFFIHPLTWGSLFLYSKYFKRVVFIGNFLVAFLCATVIVYTFLIHLKLNTQNENFGLFLAIVVSLYATFAFITNIIREIIKDIIDINGDKKIKAKTLPIVLGRKRTKNIVIVSTIFFLLLLIVIYRFLILFGGLFLYFQLFVTLPLLYFTYKLFKASSKKDYTFLSTLMKVIMLLGILSMLLCTDTFHII